MATGREGHPRPIKMETEVKQKLKFSLPSPCTTQQGVSTVTGCPEPRAVRKPRTQTLPTLSPGDPRPTKPVCTPVFSWGVVGDVFLFLPIAPGRETEIETVSQTERVLNGEDKAEGREKVSFPLTHTPQTVGITSLWRIE